MKHILHNNTISEFIDSDIVKMKENIKHGWGSKYNDIIKEG